MNQFVCKLTLLAILICCGCSTLKQSADQTAGISYGAYPEHYRRLIAEYMTPFLHDPDSSLYTNWRGPGRGFLTTGTGIIYGYRVCTDLDFRTKTGLYNGSRPYLFIINNGRIMAHEGGHPAGTAEADLLSRVCKGL